MVRKVFISFLGTNNYVECVYNIDGRQSKPVRFVQEALINDICADWTGDDRIYIFCTSDAERLNWVDNGHGKPVEEIDKIGLETRLKGLELNVPYEKIHVEEGFSEDSIWNIFETVYEKLQEGDQIYFDVTHAFRSIPLFSTVLFNYSRFMKGTNIVLIMYGAFEKLGSTFKIREKTIKERGVAPIIDLTNVLRLQEYTEIANNLVSFGKTKLLSTQLQSDNSNSDMLDSLCESITNLDEYIATNQLSKIRDGKFIAKFRCNVKAVANKQPKPIKEILKKIKTETDDFVAGKDNKNIESAIKWAKEHEMLLQAYSLAAEYIVLRISEFFASKNPFGADSKAKKNFREFISHILGIPEEEVQESEFRGILVGHDSVILELWKDDLIVKIRPEYEKIRKRRNSIIHGNGEFPYHKENGDDLDSDFYPIFNRCMDIINSFVTLQSIQQ